MTEWGTQLYFGARLIYVALYAAGVFWRVRSFGMLPLLELF